jgi:hypothetical protein
MIIEDELSFLGRNYTPEQLKSLFDAACPKTKGKKPKLKFFELPKGIDFTGEKAYSAYRKAKKEYIKLKK